MKIYVVVEYNTDITNGLYGTIVQEWFFKYKKDAEKLMKRFADGEDWFELQEIPLILKGREINDKA